MAQSHRAINIAPLGSEPLCLAYLDHPPPEGTPDNATILLIHGFPQTSHQYRHILPTLARAGYRCVAPDYRGAGHSTKDVADFSKTTLAADMIALLDALDITEPVHVIGHDIGGMLAYALASRWPDRVRSVCWGECPLPGTESYGRDRMEHAVQQFHFIFHSVPELPEALVAGKERMYVEHFLHKITYNLDAFTEADVDAYAAAYSAPGAMRCAFGVYRAFERDAAENVAWVREHGRCKVPSLVLSGEHSRHREEAEGMALEVTEDEMLEVGVVGGAAHYLTEENPEGFVVAVLAFLGKK